MGKLKLRIGSVLCLICLCVTVLIGCSGGRHDFIYNSPYYQAMGESVNAVKYIELPAGAVVDTNIVEYEKVKPKDVVKPENFIKINGKDSSYDPHYIVYVGSRTTQSENGSNNNNNYYLTFLCTEDGEIIEYYGTAVNGDAALNDPYVQIKNRCYALLSKVRHGDDYHHTLFKLSISTDIIKPTTKHDIENDGYTVLNDTPADVLITIGRDAPTGGVVYNSYYELLCSTQSNEVTAWRRLDREAESESLW